MGGYGTIKFALTQSDKFAKAAPLSAVSKHNVSLTWIGLIFPSIYHRQQYSN